MSEYVTVKNAGSKTYKEEFKGKMISLAPGESMKMERYEATQFRGSVGTSNPDKGIEKNIVIIRGEVKEPEVVSEFISHLDGKKFNSQADLDKHLESLNPADKGADRIEEDDSKKRRNILKG